jgi:hypothetical protein
MELEQAKQIIEEGLHIAISKGCYGLIEVQNIVAALQKLLNKASLIQIPSGYKDGTLYSAKPTNGDGDFTFSRGSNLAATRVNSEGLIEKGRENLLLQSNSFDTTWAFRLWIQRQFLSPNGV